MAKRMKSNNKPAIIPERRRVFPPALILTTVRMVAPAPGIPPNKAPKLFPIPCPTNSLLGSCTVFVILSATTEVNKESIAPRSARVMAVKIYWVIVSIPKVAKRPHCGMGKPVGIAAMGR